MHAAMVRRMSALTRWALPVAEALFSTEDGPPPRDRLDWLCSDFEDFVRHAGPRSDAILRGGLLVANWLAPLTIGRRPPLGRLSIVDRCRALHRAEATPAGLAILGVKAMLCILYFEHPEVRRDAGLDDGCLVGDP